MGIAKYEAKRFDGLVNHGGILASVHCDDSMCMVRAKDVLKASRGEDIASRCEATDVIESAELDGPLSAGRQ